ncbi:MAG: hypothetical protein AB7I18_10435 [Candidatus Berkiella sp.]
MSTLPSDNTLEQATESTFDSFVEKMITAAELMVKPADAKAPEDSLLEDPLLAYEEPVAEAVKELIDEESVVREGSAKELYRVKLHNDGFAKSESRTLKTTIESYSKAKSNGSNKIDLNTTGESVHGVKETGAITANTHDTPPVAAAAFAPAGAIAARLPAAAAAPAAPAMPAAVAAPAIPAAAPAIPAAAAPAIPAAAPAIPAAATPAVATPAAPQTWAEWVRDQADKANPLHWFGGNKPADTTPATPAAETVDMAAIDDLLAGFDAAPAADTTATVEAPQADATPATQNVADAINPLNWLGLNKPAADATPEAPKADTTPATPAAATETVDNAAIDDLLAQMDTPAADTTATAVEAPKADATPAQTWGEWTAQQADRINPLHWFGGNKPADTTPATPAAETVDMAAIDDLLAGFDAAPAADTAATVEAPKADATATVEAPKADTTPATQNVADAINPLNWLGLNKPAADATPEAPKADTTPATPAAATETVDNAAIDDLLAQMNAAEPVDTAAIDDLLADFDAAPAADTTATVEAPQADATPATQNVADAINPLNWFGLNKPAADATPEAPKAEATPATPAAATETVDNAAIDDLLAQMETPAADTTTTAVEAPKADTTPATPAADTTATVEAPKVDATPATQNVADAINPLNWLGLNKPAADATPEAPKADTTPATPAAATETVDNAAIDDLLGQMNAAEPVDTAAIDDLLADFDAAPAADTTATVEAPQADATPAAPATTVQATADAMNPLGWLTGLFANKPEATTAPVVAAAEQTLTEVQTIGPVPSALTQSVLNIAKGEPSSLTKDDVVNEDQIDDLLAMMSGDEKADTTAASPIDHNAVDAVLAGFDAEEAQIDEATLAALLGDEPASTTISADDVVVGVNTDQVDALLALMDDVTPDTTKPAVEGTTAGPIVSSAMKGALGTLRIATEKYELANAAKLLAEGKVQQAQMQLVETQQALKTAEVNAEDSRDVTTPGYLQKFMDFNQPAATNLNPAAALTFAQGKKAEAHNACEHKVSELSKTLFNDSKMHTVAEIKPVLAASIASNEALLKHAEDQFAPLKEAYAKSGLTGWFKPHSSAYNDAMDAVRAHEVKLTPLKAAQTEILVLEKAVAAWDQLVDALNNHARAHQHFATCQGELQQATAKVGETLPAMQAAQAEVDKLQAAHHDNHHVDATHDDTATHAAPTLVQAPVDEHAAAHTSF